MDGIIPQNLDLSTLTIEQMTLLQQEIEKHKTTARQRVRKAAKEHITQILDDAGLTVSDLPDLFPSVARSGSKVRAAYRHPQKPQLTWTGKGRRPAWGVEYLAVEGHSLRDLEVV